MFSEYFLLSKRQVIMVQCGWYKTTIYPKIPKISPGAYIFQRPFWGAYFWRGLYSHGLFTEENLRFKIDWTILIAESKLTVIVCKELRRRIVTLPTAKLKFNAHFVNDALNWEKIIACHILLPWIQRLANFSTNY